MSADGAYLRADASEAIGLGHLSRAIAMGRALRRAGVSVRVFCLAGGGRAPAKLERNKDLVRAISGDEEFLGEVERRGAKYLFIDLPERPEYGALVAGLKPLLGFYRSISFDAFFPGELRFDLQIGPTFDGTTRHAREISGLKYFVFPEELAERAPRKAPFSGARRVLITLGGSDPFGRTPAIASALAAAHPGLLFTAVVGPGFRAETRASLESLARARGSLELAREPEHLGDLYLACDAAVVSGGQTKFEAALFGLPSLIVANNAEEERLGRRFREMGLTAGVFRADRLDVDAFAAEFARFIGDAAGLERMSGHCRAAVDTLGGKRVLEHIRRVLS